MNTKSQKIRLVNVCLTLVKNGMPKEKALVLLQKSFGLTPDQAQEIARLAA